MYATSWGVSTRLIGALIMVHGDDQGLRLPPKVAPIQIVIVPIFKSDEDKEKINKFISPLIDELNQNNIRYYFDDRSKMSPGFKFNEWEMKGVPIRIEVGMRDINNNEIIYSRRDKSGKNNITIGSINGFFSTLLDDIQQSLFDQAKDFLESNTHSTDSYEDFKLLKKVVLSNVVGMAQVKQKKRLKKILKQQLDVFLLIKIQNL